MTSCCLLLISSEMLPRWNHAPAFKQKQTKSASNALLNSFKIMSNVPYQVLKSMEEAERAAGPLRDHRTFCFPHAERERIGLIKVEPNTGVHTLPGVAVHKRGETGDASPGKAFRFNQFNLIKFNKLSSTKSHFKPLAPGPWMMHQYPHQHVNVEISGV